MLPISLMVTMPNRFIPRWSSSFTKSSQMMASISDFEMNADRQDSEWSLSRRADGSERAFLSEWIQPAVCCIKGKHGKPMESIRGILSPFWRSSLPYGLFSGRFWPALSVRYAVRKGSPLSNLLAGGVLRLFLGCVIGKNALYYIWISIAIQGRYPEDETDYRHCTG